MSESVWCPLPWSHLSVKNNGSLRLCSHSQSTGNLDALLKNDGRTLKIADLASGGYQNCDTLKEVRRAFLENRWPSQCERCRIDHEVGRNSRNIWETENHQRVLSREQALASTRPDGSVTQTRVITLDLRLGNECNLRCTMCFPGESSQWMKAYEQITGSREFQVDGKIYRTDSSTNEFDWSHDEKNLDALVSLGLHFTKIKFGGGEPLLLKTCRRFVEKLAEAGHAPKIELEYSVNATVIPEAMWAIWKNFRRVKLCCSIDGIGPVIEAVRYPTKWEKVKENLKRIEEGPENLSAFISSTVHLLNLEHFVSLQKWIHESNFQKINHGMNPLGVSHPVYFPQYLSICLLDEPHRQEIFRRLEEEADRISKPSLSKRVRENVDYYHKVSLRDLRADKPIQRAHFARRFHKFAELQKQDWPGIFPFAARLTEAWQPT